MTCIHVYVAALQLIAQAFMAYGVITAFVVVPYALGKRAGVKEIAVRSPSRAAWRHVSFRRVFRRAAS